MADETFGIAPGMIETRGLVPARTTRSSRY
jgi:hypothetical protein